MGRVFPVERVRLRKCVRMPGVVGTGRTGGSSVVVDSGLRRTREATLVRARHLEEDGRLHALPVTCLREAPADSGHGSGVLDLVLGVLPGGCIHHDQGRLPVHGEDEGRPVSFRCDIKRVVSRLNSVRVRISLVMSMENSNLSHRLQCEYSAFIVYEETNC